MMTNPKVQRTLFHLEATLEIMEGSFKFQEEQYDRNDPDEVATYEASKAEIHELKDLIDYWKGVLKG